MTLVTIPILLLVPGLVLLAGAINSIVIWLFPLSADDFARFETEMAPGWVPILFGCVAAPVLEEMLFRGVILRGFLRQYSRTFAILWSAALFGAAHLNIYQLATAFAIGIVAGWLYERCRSLWPCILLHASYNGFVTLYYNWLSSQTDGAGAGWDSGPTSAAFVAAIVGGLLLLRLLDGRRPQKIRSSAQ
jgi:membrane protease YdiL (CAAX protease family)